MCGVSSHRATATLKPNLGQCVRNDSEIEAYLQPKLKRIVALRVGAVFRDRRQWEIVDRLEVVAQFLERVDGRALQQNGNGEQVGPHACSDSRRRTCAGEESGRLCLVQKAPPDSTSSKCIGQ